jgi:hypothetical protein
MSTHIVDDEQHSDRRATPMRPLGSGLEGASASLALLDDVRRHRLRRAALHLPIPSQERGPFQFSDRLLDHGIVSSSFAHRSLGLVKQSLPIPSCFWGAPVRSHHY